MGKVSIQEAIDNMEYNYALAQKFPDNQKEFAAEYFYSDPNNYNEMAELNKNLQANAIPQLIFDATYKDFEPFLSERRRLMATKIEKYYKSL